MSAQTTPYIGSKISLISKLDIRYEGILYAVNTNDSTIALVKVRSLGTEERPVTNPVPARDDVYEHIIFKASDIKDLIVCETPKPPTIGGLPYDPAIVSVSSRPEPNQSGNSSRPNTPGRSSPGSAPSNRAPGAGRQPPQQGRPMQPPQHLQARGGYSQLPKQYNNQNYNRGYGAPPQPLMGTRGRTGFARNQNQNPPREKLRFDSDYDFEKANEQFQETLSDLLRDKATLSDKDGEDEQEKPENSSPTDEVDSEAFYNKSSSFFDRISCEALEKAEGRKARPDWRKERETNQETFGHQAVRSLNYRRGFGRGRGMGGPNGRYNAYNNGYNSYRGNGYNNQGYNNRGGFRRNNQQPSQQPQS